MYSYKFGNPQQEQIHRRLNLLVGLGAAAFYRDACRIMETEPPLESTTHLIGHLLREIESSLRDVLKKIGEPLQQSPKQEKPSGDKHKAQIIAILQALNIAETSSVAQTWLSLAGGDSEYRLHKQAHRDDLAPPRPINEKFRLFWNDIQGVLDQVLDRFETRYLDVRQTLDQLLAKLEPGDKDLSILRLNIPNSLAGLGYFFENLQSPGWLHPLWKEGFFANVPQPEEDIERGTIRFIHWQQSRYLTRMAFQEPETVLKIALEIVETGTKNVDIHEDLAEAALVMSPELAARWVEKETEWLKKQDYLYLTLPDKLGKLIAYLAENKQVNTALGLARELLAVLPSSKRSSSIEIRTRCDDYNYGIILEENIPKLLSVASEDTLHLLCHLLSNAIKSLQLPHENRIFEDYSYNWYRSFEKKQNQYDVRSLLTAAIWKTAEQIVRDNLTQVGFIVKTLEGYHWRIFNRMALHLLSNFPNGTLDLIAKRLPDQQRLNDSILCYEYAILLKDHFTVLAPELQDKILNWIEQGPNDTSWLKEEKITAYIKHWQRDWLSILNNSLPVEWQEYYKQLVDEIGPAKALEPAGGNIAWEGPTSVKSAEELAIMSMAELITFLDRWQPTGELLTPSRDGLGMELSKVIAQKPQDFINEIEQFRQLNPKYRCWLLRGLNDALLTHEQQAFSWRETLKFCSWVMEKQQNIFEDKVSPGEFNWELNQICDAVVNLLDNGLQPIGQNEIPLEFRSQVWRILEQITEDSRVTPGFETHYHSSNMTPVEASVNTVRGQAMHAVIKYMLWLLRHTNKEENQEEQKVWDFEEIPEVRALLERHLNPEYDCSLTIRSVYGQNLPYLMSIDSKWTIRNLEIIFPKDKVLQELRDAAWEAYVAYNQASTDLFNLLREEYNHAVERMGAYTNKWQNRSRANEGLAAHLLNLYWYCELELDESNDLLDRFFVNAPAYNREEFMRQIAWRLRYGKSEIGSDLLKRLQRIWEWRVSKVICLAANDLQASDLRYFSWWFSSRKFEDEWAIAQLINAFKFGKNLDHDQELVKHLFTLAPSMPFSVINCLSLMAEANGIRSHNWFDSYHQEDHRSILRSVLQFGDEETRITAKELINRLSARGIADFIDLLSDR
jgi:hypothetical protein